MADPLTPTPPTTPAWSPTADRPPRTPRWVWVFGSIVGLFLLAVGAFFLAGGDHGGGDGGGGHGAGENNPGAFEGATAPNVQVPAGLQVATSGYTLSPISVPDSAGEAGTLGRHR